VDCLRWLESCGRLAAVPDDPMQECCAARLAGGAHDVRSFTDVPGG